MWKGGKPPRSGSGFAAGTLESDMSEAERPNARHNIVSVTLLEDRAPSALIALDAPRVRGARGQELQVSLRSAAALERAGTAVRVDTAKMGAAQRRLLLTLYDLTVEEERPPTVAPGRAIGLNTGLLTSPYRGTRLRWSTSLVSSLDTSAARSSVAQALAALDRRGLVLRYPIGGRRTQQVELTQAGRRVALGLARKP